MEYGEKEIYVHSPLLKSIPELILAKEPPKRLALKQHIVLSDRR